MLGELGEQAIDLLDIGDQNAAVREVLYFERSAGEAESLYQVLSDNALRTVVMGAYGLPEEMATRLARATVCGAGELAHQSPESAAQLRINVTSPGGTTAAALGVLMNETDGFAPLLARAVQAAADRSRELGQ